MTVSPSWPWHLVFLWAQRQTLQNPPPPLTYQQSRPKSRTGFIPVGRIHDSCYNHLHCRRQQYLERIVDDVNDLSQTSPKERAQTQKAWESERNSLESDRGRGRSERRADAKQMLVGFTGGSRASVYAGFDRQAPHLTGPQRSAEARAERGADQVAATVFLHGKLGTLWIEQKALKRIHSVLSAPSSASRLFSVQSDGVLCDVVSARVLLYSTLQFDIFGSSVELSSNPELYSHRRSSSDPVSPSVMSELITSGQL